MGKNLYIAEKPSVALEFAKVLHIEGARKDGYLESSDSIVTWCVGHLVKLSYPESYDPNLKKWSLATIPFIPSEWKYEIIAEVKKQFDIVSSLLNREDVETIYVCTDSGREGEYIYRLVSQEAHVSGKKEKRVWIDSQTEEEILRGIKEAKDLSAYDSLASAAYLRAKEDYLMGINFSRALSLRFGSLLASVLGTKYESMSIGRVMTCVLGMVVRREREIRDFKNQPFYRIIADSNTGNASFESEWRVTKASSYFESPILYKENGFRKKEDAEKFLQKLSTIPSPSLSVEKIEKKTEKKKPPLLYNLAELQNECAKRFKISPDETLTIAQELYEKKLITYPRTDARVVSKAVCKEIRKNLTGLTKISSVAPYAKEVLEKGTYTKLADTIYCDDKKITDHYALIPTGVNEAALSNLSRMARNVYELIARRFLSIFYPPSVFTKYALEAKIENESFFANFKFLEDEGYLLLWHERGKEEKKPAENTKEESSENDSSEEDFSNTSDNTEIRDYLHSLKKNALIPVSGFRIKEGQATPPKRYNSGALILAMENAGQLIEDEDLRALIKGSGIGTSATRAEIIKKLITIGYLKNNTKTQIITPTLKGECNFDIVVSSMPSLLNPDLTASWEKGLTGVADGTITEEEYWEKLTHFVLVRTNAVKNISNPNGLRQVLEKNLLYYSSGKKQ